MVAGSLRVLPASSTIKTGRHDIAEILLKVALNTINQSINQTFHIKTLKTQTYKPRHVAFKIQVLPWDRHTNMTGYNYVVQLPLVICFKKLLFHVGHFLLM